MGIGITYLSGTDDVLTGVVAQKQFFFGPTLNPLSLKVKAQADYNTQTQQVNLSPRRLLISPVACLSQVLSWDMAVLAGLHFTCAPQNMICFLGLLTPLTMTACMPPDQQFLL